MPARPAKDGGIVTSGGRVLCVVGLGETIADAQQRAYQRVENLKWRAMYYRRDIGFRTLQKGTG